MLSAAMLSIYLLAEPRCLRWYWVGKDYTRVSICLEWSKPKEDKDKKK